jgi:hypothetical protein
MITSAAFCGVSIWSVNGSRIVLGEVMANSWWLGCVWKG